MSGFFHRMSCPPCSYAPMSHHRLLPSPPTLETGTFPPVCLLEHIHSLASEQTLCFPLLPKPAHSPMSISRPNRVPEFLSRGLTDSPFLPSKTCPAVYPQSRPFSHPESSLESHTHRLFVTWPEPPSSVLSLAISLRISSRTCSSLRPNSFLTMISWKASRCALCIQTVLPSLVRLGPGSAARWFCPTLVSSSFCEP